MIQSGFSNLREGIQKHELLQCEWFLLFQVVNVSRLEGDDNPVQLIYFVEDQDGERLSAVKSSDLINKMDLQRAAIILGYRIQGAIAQRKCLRCCHLGCAGLQSQAHSDSEL